MNDIQHLPTSGPDFEQMFQAMKRDSLILLDGGFCHFNHRRDNGLTIYSIFSQVPGKGQQMLLRLIALKPAWIRAVCPQDLESNQWYEKRFELIATKESKTGRQLNVWQITFPNNPSKKQ
jgi:hypothetical protein